MFFHSQDEATAESTGPLEQNPTPGVPVSFGERFEMEMRAQERDRNMSSLENNRDDIVFEQVKRAKELGYELSPIRKHNISPRSLADWNDTADRVEKETGEKLLRFNYTPGTSYGDAFDAFDEEIQRRAEPERLEEESVRARSRGFVAGLGGFAGAAIGSFKDPVVAITLPLGSFEAGFAKAILTEAAINMALEVPTQALLVMESKKRGIDVTAGSAVVDVLFAGVAGGAFTAAGKGLAAGVGKALDKFLPPDAAKLKARLENPGLKPLTLREKAILAGEIDRVFARMPDGKVAEILDTMGAPLTPREQFYRQGIEMREALFKSPFGDSVEADAVHMANLNRTLEEIVQDEPGYFELLELRDGKVVTQRTPPRPTSVEIDPAFDGMKSPAPGGKRYIHLDREPRLAATSDLDALTDPDASPQFLKEAAEARLAEADEAGLGDEIIDFDENGKGVTAAEYRKQFEQEEKLLEAMRFCKLR